MIYRVRARFRSEMADEFLRKLRTTIGRQVPDGAEIVASMNRAVVTDNGLVEWTELCFCPTPLEHERRTVLDTYFENITTEVVQSHQRIDGIAFMDHLTRPANPFPERAR